MFFWMTIAGGLLMLVAWVFNPGGIVGTMGFVLFVVGVVGFFVLALLLGELGRQRETDAALSRAQSSSRPR